VGTSGPPKQLNVHIPVAACKLSDSGSVEFLQFFYINKLIYPVPIWAFPF